MALTQEKMDRMRNIAKPSGGSSASPASQVMANKSKPKPDPTKDKPGIFKNLLEAFSSGKAAAGDVVNGINSLGGAVVAKVLGDDPSASRLIQEAKGSASSYVRNTRDVFSSVGETGPGKLVVAPAIGAAKELGNQALNIGELGAKGLESVTGLVGLKTPESVKSSSGMKSIREVLQAEGLPEEIGGGILNVLEFAAPAGKIAEGGKFIDLILSGKGILSKVGRVGAKATTEGLSAIPIATVQTGDTSEGAKAGLATVAFSGLTYGVGEAARATGIPAKIYQRFFKSTADDAMAELKGLVNQETKKTDPALYQKYLDAGIIKEVNGQMIFDESTAKKALDAGLRGSYEDMARTVITTNQKNELAAQTIAKGIKEPLKIHPNIKKTLEDIAQKYAKVGTGETASEASQLANSIKSGRSKMYGGVEDADRVVSAEDALRIRRFLDRMRKQASYETSSPLATSAQNLKDLSDNLRRQVNDLPGMKKVMESYSNNIDFAESLGKELSKNGNSELARTMDAAIFGGGIVSGHPAEAVAIKVLKWLFANPKVLTNIGQTLNQTVPSVGGVTARGALGSAFPGIEEMIQEDE